MYEEDEMVVQLILMSFRLIEGFADPIVSLALFLLADHE